MYKIIAIMSLYLRMYILPNPFESFEYGIIINILIEPILHIITYTIVGIFYNRGETPTLGSILYFLFFCINIGLIQIWAKFGAIPLTGVVIIVVYFMVIIMINNRINRFIY